jgi:hypothetical protein
MIQTSSRLEGIGEYYFSRKLREIDEMNKKGLQVINLGIGSPDLPPHPDVIRVLQEESAKPNVHAYQSYKGSPILRLAVAEWYKTWYGVTLEPDTQILPLIGSKEGIMHICMTYLNKGDEDFWRIGASRDHALLLKKEDKFLLYNISQSYAVYILKPPASAKPLIHLARIEPVPGVEKKEKLSVLLAKIKEAAVNDLLDHPEISGHLESLPGIVNWSPLENNDLIVIGNKVFKFIVPVVMESLLSDRVRRSILRKIQFKDSVLRK